MRLYHTRGVRIPRPQAEAFPQNEIVELAYQAAEWASGLPREYMSNPTKDQKFVMARYVFFWVMIHESRVTMTGIAKFFHKDHATVCHAYNVLRNFMATDPHLRCKFEIMFSGLSLANARSGIELVDSIIKHK